MSHIYSPDKWLLVKIGGTDPHYRVFGSWSGGYTDSDSWRMNSGITRVEEDETHYYFYGSSGSQYSCSKQMYGATVYGWGVITSHADGERFAIMEEPDNIMDIDWIIK